MHLLDKYETIILDCDGVILDSNVVKIDAMKLALENHISQQETEVCLAFFRANFGRSRFFHVDHFVEKLIKTKDSKEQLKQSILTDFTEICSQNYGKSPITSGFIENIACLRKNMYVASGSEQNELRKVLGIKGLNKLFLGIFGSPETKANIVASVLSGARADSAVLIGDSLADIEAAEKNNIDFIGYTPYSNTPIELINECTERKYPILNSWDEVYG